ncbi:glycosyltransferase family 2 protein [Sporolactobacillus laevolacticus]|uniref:glycosyltransferase family 2 protein n=1 Tax=Sporolactobacillus laevolacticus TaxID=33018 RepID=UPI00191BD044|nr:glycosyltransferase family 2 protein [Sporolactobacillus laevolacticus]
MQTFIIILNWNGWKDTRECVKSILLNDNENYQIIIVDNKSTDDSVSQLKHFIMNEIEGVSIEEYIADSERNFKRINHENSPNKKSIVFIQSYKNLGYAGGNNLGLLFASKSNMNSAKLILNNDTTVNSDFISNVEQTISKNIQISLLGFPALDYNNHQSVEVYYVKDRQLWGVQKVTELDGKKDQHLIECESLGGHAMLITPLSPEQFLPEEFFLYCEESEFCQRVNKKGGKIYLSLETPVFHKHSGTVGLNSPLQVYYYNRNILYYMRANRQWYVFLLFYLLKLSKSCIVILKYLIKGNYIHAKALLKANIDFIAGKRGKQWVN